jgi:hypothetical protein
MDRLPICAEDVEVIPFIRLTTPIQLVMGTSSTNKLRGQESAPRQNQ